MTDQPEPAVTPVAFTGDEPVPRVVDLSEARRARREHREQPTLAFLGQVYPLPWGADPKILDLVPDLAKGGQVSGETIIALDRLLLTDTVFDDIEAKAAAEGDPLTFEDYIYLMRTLLGIYGVSLGESLASVSSSSSTGPSSKPTTPITTGKT